MFSRRSLSGHIQELRTIWRGSLVWTKLVLHKLWGGVGERGGNWQIWWNSCRPSPKMTQTTLRIFWKTRCSNIVVRNSCMGSLWRKLGTTYPPDRLGPESRKKDGGPAAFDVTLGTLYDRGFQNCSGGWSYGTLSVSKLNLVWHSVTCVIRSFVMMFRELNGLDILIVHLDIMWVSTLCWSRHYVGLDIMLVSTLCRSRHYVGLGIMSVSALCRSRHYVGLDIMLVSALCRSRHYVGLGIMSVSALCRSRHYVGLGIMLVSALCRSRHYVGLDIMSVSALCWSRHYVGLDIMLVSALCRSRHYAGLDIMSVSALCRSRHYVGLGIMSVSALCWSRHYVGLGRDYI